MGGESADTKERPMGAASLLRPDGHQRRGLALAHPAKKDEPDRRVGAATRLGFDPGSFRSAPLF